MGTGAPRTSAGGTWAPPSPAAALSWSRQGEQYQYKEKVDSYTQKKQGGQTETKKRYYYSKGWSSHAETFTYGRAQDKCRIINKRPCASRTQAACQPLTPRTPG